MRGKESVVVKRRKEDGRSERDGSDGGGKKTGGKKAQLYSR